MTTEKKAVWVVFRPTESVNLKKIMVTQGENSWLAKD